MAPRVSARDEPGKSREYESIIILSPELLDDGVATINKKVQGIVEKNGGKLIRVESWGKRRLAYRLKGQQKGIYFYWRILGGPLVVAEMRRSLRVMDSVLRCFSVKLDENIDPDARPGDIDETVLDPTLGKPDPAETAGEQGAAREAQDTDGESAKAETTGEVTQKVEEKAPQAAAKETRSDAGADDKQSAKAATPPKEESSAGAETAGEDKKAQAAEAETAAGEKADAEETGTAKAEKSEDDPK
jgi:small subunit ribosomal protein S6